MDRYAKAIFLSASYFALICCLLSWSWRKWPDAQMDFGYSLYNIWVLAKGKILYRDVHHVYGPLAPILYSAGFRFLGRSLDSIFAMNLAFIGVIAGLIRKFMKYVVSPFAGEISALVFLLVFAFGQLISRGGYNFMAPYKLEVAPGMAIIFGLIEAYRRHEKSKSDFSIFVAGILFGLLFLVSIEFIVAGVACSALSLVLLRRLRSAAILLLGGSLPVITAIFSFLPVFSFDRAIRYSLQGLLAPFSFPSVASMHAHLMGLDAPLLNFLAILREALVFGAVGIVFFIMDERFAAGWEGARSKRHFVVIGLVLFMSILAGALSENYPAWVNFAKVLPLTSFAALCAALVAHRRAKDADAKSRYFAVSIFAALSLVLLARIILNPMLQHFGFYMALPATVLAVSLPHLFQERWLSKALCVGLALGMVVQTLQRSNVFYKNKNFEVGEGRDKIYTYSPEITNQGPVLKETLDFLKREIRAEHSVLCISECSMLHYLARRERASRYSFIDFETMAYGADFVTSDFMAGKPDHVIVLHQPQESGVSERENPLNYAPLKGWLSVHYKSQKLIGAEPFSGRRWGARAYRRLGLPCESERN